MKRRLRLFLFFLAASALLPPWKAGAQAPGTPRSREAAGIPFRLEYRIHGSAISRLLFIFPLRVFYEASAAVDLAAVVRDDGVTLFSYDGLPRPAFVMRTLGFGGKSLAILTVPENQDQPGAIADGLLSQWRLQAPEFAARVKKIKKFPHQLPAPQPQAFVFSRDAKGFYFNSRVKLEPRYLRFPARTGINFKVFPTLAELLKLLNHPFLPPDPANGMRVSLPAEWQGDDLDLSADLNRVAGLIEEVVKSLVTVEQRAPFRIHFRSAAARAGEIEIRGEAHPDVIIWKGFMIREIRRIVRLRADNRELLQDEFSIEIRNKKGQGGSGRLLLKRMDPKEDEG